MAVFSESPMSQAAIPLLFDALGVSSGAKQAAAQTKLINTETDAKQFDLNNAKSLFQGLSDHDANGFGYSQPFESLQPEQQSDFLNRVYSKGFKGDPTQAINAYRSMYDARNIPSTGQLFSQAINGSATPPVTTAPASPGTTGTTPNTAPGAAPSQPAGALPDLPFSPRPSVRFGVIPKIGANGQRSLEMEKLIGAFTPAQRKHLDDGFANGDMNAWSDVDEAIQKPAQQYLQAKIDDQNRLFDHVQKFNTLMQDTPAITSYVGGGKDGEGFLPVYRQVQSIWSSHVGKDGRFDSNKPLTQQESLALAYRIARMDNPGAIAREGTLEQMMAGSSKWDTIKAAAQNAISGQSKIPAQTVQDMVDVINKYKSVQQPAFEAALSMKEPLMARFGIRPEDVIGDSQALTDYRKNFGYLVPNAQAAKSDPSVPVGTILRDPSTQPGQAVVKTGKSAGTPSSTSGSPAPVVTDPLTPPTGFDGNPSTPTNVSNPSTARPLRISPRISPPVRPPKPIQPSHSAAPTTPPILSRPDIAAVLQRNPPAANTIGRLKFDYGQFGEPNIRSARDGESALNIGVGAFGVPTFSVGATDDGTRLNSTKGQIQSSIDSYTKALNAFKGRELSASEQKQASLYNGKLEQLRKDLDTVNKTLPDLQSLRGNLTSPVR